MQLTDEALAEWRAHPVTEYVRAVLGKSLGFQRGASTWHLEKAAPRTA